MRKLDSRIAEPLKRFVFIAALVLAGFGIERAWQSYRASVEKNDRLDVLLGPGRQRIVIVGGSVTIGIGKSLERYLRAFAKRDDIDVINLSVPMTSPRESATIARGALETYRPSMLLLMIGIVDGAANEGWSQKTEQLVADKRVRELVEHFDAAFQKKDYLRPFAYVVSFREKLEAIGFIPVFSDFARSKLERLAAESLRDDEKLNEALWLARVGLALQRPRLDTGKPMSDLELIDWLGPKLDDLALKLKAWAGPASKTSHGAFVGASSDAEAFLRSWYWITWGRRDPTKDREPIVYYSTQPGYLWAILPGQGFLVTRARVGDELRKRHPGLVQAITAMQKPPKGISRPTGIGAEAVDFGELPLVIEEAKAAGIQTVFLHYPNLNLSSVDELGSRFDVPVIGDAELFTEAIAKDGYGAYFLDYYQGTGHLTDAGLEIYSKYLASRLSARDSQRTRYVVIGGSIALGLGSKIESHLRRIAKSDAIDVIEMSDVMMTIDDAIARAKVAIAKHHPKAILFMVGMGESDYARTDWMKKADELLERSRWEDLASHIAMSFDRGGFRHPMFFVIRKRDLLQKSEFARAFLPKIRWRFARSDLPLESKLWFVSLAMATHKYANRVDFTKRSDHEVAAERLYARISSLLRQMKRWAKTSEKEGFEKFVAGASDQREEILRSWFWATWSARDRKVDRDVVEYYTKHANYLVHVITRDLHSIEDPKLRLMLEKKEPRRLMAAFLETKFAIQDLPIGRPGTSESSPASDAQLIIEEVPRLLDDVREAGVEPILLHYPMWRMEALDRAAKNGEARIIGGEESLRRLIRENGRSAYFVDQAGGTGHLSEAGLDAYGRAIAEAMAPEASPQNRDDD